MKRTQVQLDEQSWQAIREKAFLEKRSISSLIRDTLKESVGDGGKTRRYRITSFSFVGYGKSTGKDAGKIAFEKAGFRLYQ